MGKINAFLLFGFLLFLSSVGCAREELARPIADSIDLTSDGIHRKFTPSVYDNSRGIEDSWAVLDQYYIVEEVELLDENSILDITAARLNLDGQLLCEVASAGQVKFLDFGPPSNYVIETDWPPFFEGDSYYAIPIISNFELSCTNRDPINLSIRTRNIIVLAFDGLYVDFRRIYK